VRGRRDPWALVLLAVVLLGLLLVVVLL